MSDIERDDETPEEPAPVKPKKKGKSKLLVMGIPVFMLLMGGGAGAWWYFNQGAASGAGGQEVEGEGGMVSLDSFVANLADPGGRKYVRVTMTMLVPDEATALAFEANKMAISKVRSAILEVLVTKTTADISTAEGRAALKKSIGETVNRVAHLDVRDVLFEEFIIQ